MNRIEALRHVLTTGTVNHKKQVMAERTLKGAHSYCVANRVSSQQVGTLIEGYMINTMGFKKVPASECRGDFLKAGLSYELKVSLGGSDYNKPKYNYVQIRPAHNIDRYLLTAFHLNHSNVEDGGELYVFDVPSDEMKSIVVDHGGYAHGTTKENGKINKENLGNFEYAIRPTIGSKCWDRLMKHIIYDIAG